MIRNATLWAACLSICWALVAPEASAQKTAPELLETLSGEGSTAERAAAAEELTEHGDEIEVLKAFLLERERTSTADQRRQLLYDIGASVPDKKGRFRNPRRKSDEQKQKEDDFDWLEELLERDPSSAAVRESVADVAAIRALAKTGGAEGGELIFQVAFADDSMVYRDECGRYMRKMAPYSLPALFRRAAITKKYSSERRYAKYQLERMDLESPKKALRAVAGDEKLMATLLVTFGESGYRPAVAQVLEHTNDEAPAVRKAARTGWMHYVDNPAPEPPKRKLVLPGGKRTNEEQPLYYNYTTLARIEIRRTYEEVMGEEPPKKAGLKELSEKLFAHWDAERHEAENEKIDRALARAKDGDLEGAVKTLDQLLALDEEPDAATEIAAVYWKRASQLEQAGEWRPAARAYRKAHALDPEGENATTALASHYFSLAKAVEAEGGDPRPLYARASEIQPQEERERRALGGSSSDKPTWMLYAGVGGGVAAVILLVVGLMIRRQHQH